MTKEPTKAEKALHIDLALASAYEAKRGETLTFREISELSGIKLEKVQAYYDSGMKKLERRLKRIMEDELDGKSR